jgi:hypothetical protein
MHVSFCSLNVVEFAGQEVTNALNYLKIEFSRQLQDGIAT